MRINILAMLGLAFLIGWVLAVEVGKCFKEPPRPLNQDYVDGYLAGVKAATEQ